MQDARVQGCARRLAVRARKLIAVDGNLKLTRRAFCRYFRRLVSRSQCCSSPRFHSSHVRFSTIQQQYVRVCGCTLHAPKQFAFARFDSSCHSASNISSRKHTPKSQTCCAIGPCTRSALRLTSTSDRCTIRYIDSAKLAPHTSAPSSTQI